MDAIRYYCWDENGGVENGFYVTSNCPKGSALAYAGLLYVRHLAPMQNYTVVVRQSGVHIAQEFEIQTVLEPTFFAERID